MELRITGRHAQLPQKVKTYARTKLEPLARYYVRTRQLEVILDEENQSGWRIEVIAHLSSGTPIVASLRHEDPLAAIDLAHDKLERLLTRAKEKSRTKRRTSARGAAKAPVDGKGDTNGSSAREEE